MSDMIYRLVLKAQFEGSEELERATRGLQQLQLTGAQVNISMAGAGKQAGFGLDSLARSAMRVGFMFNMMESAFMRTTMAEMLMTNAQERYNDVVARYGANSAEAIKATKQLESQVNYLNLANMRANVSMGLLGIQIALQSNLLNKATLSQIAHTVATHASTLADWAKVAALKAQAVMMGVVSMGAFTPAMLIGGAAAAGIVGGLTLSTMAAQPKSQINIKTDVNVETDLDDALAENNRKVKSEYSRLRP